MLRATLKSLFSRKARLGLTALSIVLGVGFVVGTFVLTDTMNKAFDDLFKTANSGTDVVVRATSAFSSTQGGGGGGGGNSDRGPIPETLLPTVQGVSGVASASGVVGGYAQMIDPATGKAIGSLGPPTIGANWTTTNPSVVLRSGSAPVDSSQAVVDAATAKKHNLSVGQQIRILFQGPPQEFTISGIAGFGSADNLAGATVVFFDTPTAQAVLGKKGKFDEIDVVAAQGVEATQLRTQIQEVMPQGVEAVTSTTVAAEQAKQLEQGLGFFRTVLLVFAFIAVFVGGFIIFNTFSIIVAQRSRELALLRALGASRRQVLGSVIGEAFVVGLIASLVGVLAGIVIAIGLKAVLKAFGIDLPSTALQLHTRTIVVALIVGCVITVVASVMPAIRASRVSPVEAMSDTGDGGGRTTSLRRRWLFGLPVTGVGVGLLLLGLFGHVSAAASIVGLGAALTFIGITILAPILTRPVAGTLGAPIQSLSLVGRLGRQNAIRTPRRTAATASALMVGLGLIAMVAVLSASLKASFTGVLERDLRADLIVSTSSFTSFSPDVAAKARAVTGVAAASEVRQAGFRVGGKDGFLTAVDPATIDQVAGLGLAPGGTDALAAGKVLVYKTTADANGWKEGDSIPAAFPTMGSHPLTMGGTFTQNQVVGGDYLISLDTYTKLFPEQLDSIVFIKVAPGADVAQVKTGVEAATREFGNVTVQDQAAFRAQQASQVNRLLGLVTALLAMAVFIALFGIVNTLGLSIFERRHEIGLLRAVGMTRRQTKRMIRWEAIIIALFGGVLGLAVGLLFGWALQSSLADQGVDQLAIPGSQLLFWLVFAAVCGVLAAAWPARRASRLNVLEAISYE